MRAAGPKCVCVDSCPCASGECPAKCPVAVVPTAAKVKAPCLECEEAEKAYQQRQAARAGTPTASVVTASDGTRYQLGSDGRYHQIASGGCATGNCPRK